MKIDELTDALIVFFVAGLAIGVGIEVVDFLAAGIAALIGG